MRQVAGIVLLLGMATAVHAEEPGLKNESEAGVVITSGNSSSQSYNLKQSTTYSEASNLLRFQARYLKTKNDGVEAAKSWSLGLRYERSLSEMWSAFLAETLESDVFAGILQRYSTDIGAKAKIIHEEGLNWSAEGGYRFTHENKTLGGTLNYHYARLYTEVERKFNASTSAKLWAEFLPNFTDSDDYLINSEVSVSAAMSAIFSLKVAYMVKYDHLPNPGVAHQTDSIFTTALVAKF